MEDNNFCFVIDGFFEFFGVLGDWWLGVVVYWNDFFWFEEFDGFGGFFWFYCEVFVYWEEGNVNWVVEFVEECYVFEDECIFCVVDGYFVEFNYVVVGIVYVVYFIIV